MSNLVSHAGRGVFSGITAIGADQASGFALLNNTDHQFTTVAPSTAARLPTARVPDRVAIWNGGLNALAIYPPLGGKINDGTTNGVYSVAVGSGISFFAADLGLWYTSSSSAAGAGSGTVTSVAAGAGLAGGTITTTGTVSLTIPVVVASGGTGDVTLASHAVLVGAGTSAVAFATVGTAGRLLIDQGASADPSFNAMSGDAVITSAGAITVSKVGAKAVTLGGAFTTSGAFTTTLTVTGNTNVTLPTSGTLTTNLGTVTSIVAGTGLAGGTVTTTGTFSLATIATMNLLANITGGTAAPIANTLTATIDAAIGSVQGDLLYRGASAWSVLAPGTTGQVLASQGAAADPHWITVSGTGTVTSAAMTVPVDLAVAGSPITTTGTFAITRVAMPSSLFDYTYYGGV